METLARRIVTRFSSRTASHVQVFVKVNAYVDEGIASVIEALSLIPRLHTIASCQGDQVANIQLRYGDKGENLPEGRPVRHDQIDLYCWFKVELRRRLPYEKHSFIIDDVVGQEEVAFTLTFERSITDDVASAVIEIARASEAPQ